MVSRLAPFGPPARARRIYSQALSLYRLSPERAEQLQQKGCTPSAVTVTSRGVEITFEAVKR